jgi:hypothetical protein
MPLSRPTSRKLLHLRDIQLRGYQREDGLVDIEARMTDTKTYSWNNPDRGAVNSGEPLHDMWMRVTIDQNMTVHGCEAAMDATPYSACPSVAPNFQRLAGLTIGKGFIKAAMLRLGGVEGCTHLRELLQPIATVAFQTMVSVRRLDKSGQPKSPRPFVEINPALVNTCHAYDENGPLVASAAVKLASDE